MENIVEYYTKKVDFTVAQGLEGVKCLEKTCELIDKVRSLIWDALPNDLSENEKKLEMLKIFYERDFTPENFEKWLTIMRKAYGLAK